MSANASAVIPEDGKKRYRKDSVATTPMDESQAFCETMLGLAEFHIKEDPSLDQPDQLTLRNFRKIYRIPVNTEGFATKLLDHTDLRVSEGDPADAPGLASFIRLLSNNRPETWDDPMENAKRLLIRRKNKEYTKDAFAVGKTIGGRWVIMSELNGVKGSCNQGILFVLDRISGLECIMKLLTSEAMDPGCPGREIDIVRRLSHPNIVSFYDAHLSCTITERFATPYLVTEYCNKGTLLRAIKRSNQAGDLIPERFVWQVFEALVSAVKYLHHGPDNARPSKWDAISHRDIIPSNIFCTLDESVSTGDYPISIKLADFGCAISDSEMAAHPIPIEDLPLVSGKYIPPEDAQPTEATDMYQVGLVLSLMYCMTDDPSEDISDVGYLYQNHLPGYTGYTSELRMYLEMCLDLDERQRPKSNTFLLRIQSGKRLLSRTGKLDTYSADSE
ncbi:NIMA-related kinase 2 [Alternaria panax]|uniref:non-specific serine/threonine protein kinase n=1 Tax=Alternaria panax TaxID=48097 RepID=A0AAD4IJC1_9PLEO|nr:NIMA-related kinase 2 [Alternaria panax]